MDEDKNMPSLVDLLTDLFKDAITKAYPDLPDAPCPVAPSAKQGDYQFNGAMPIAGLLKVKLLYLRHSAISKQAFLGYLYY